MTLLKSSEIKWFVVLMLAMFCGMTSTVAEAANPLPRICVRDGKFVEQASKKEFHPRGFQYVRIGFDGHHYVFAPSLYSPNCAEAMLADLSRNGFNIVRVFIGRAETVEGDGLSPRFMASFCDFLKRAERHGIHVIVVVDWIANCKRYNDIIGDMPKNMEGKQVFYLNQKHVDAKALYLQDFVNSIKKQNPRLLSTIFAYELENEACLESAFKPFSETSGTFEFNGKSYDMSSGQQIQELADEAFKRRCDSLVKAIHTVDPDVMVSCSVYSFNAVGRSGPGALRTDKAVEQHFPMRPLALVDTKLSYIDIHLYSYNEEGLDRDLQSIEWENLKPACKKAGKPLFMGECGAYKFNHASLQEAAALMRKHIERVIAKGFKGYSYWTYDCDEQTELYNAKMEDGVIFRAITEANARLKWTQNN